MQHIFVDPLRPCPRTPAWPYDKSCQLLSDSLVELKQFAYMIHLSPDWLLWSADHVPYYALTERLRLTAILAGAVEISPQEASSLATLWLARNRAALERLKHPPLLPPPPPTPSPQCLAPQSQPPRSSDSFPTLDFRL